MFMSNNIEGCRNSQLCKEMLTISMRTLNLSTHSRCSELITELNMTQRQFTESLIFGLATSYMTQCSKTIALVINKIGECNKDSSFIAFIFQSVYKVAV